MTFTSSCLCVLLSLFGPGHVLSTRSRLCHVLPKPQSGIPRADQQPGKSSRFPPTLGADPSLLALLQWVPLEYTLAGRSVTLVAPQGPIAAVRYAVEVKQSPACAGLWLTDWVQDIPECVLYNDQGFAASPFQMNAVRRLHGLCCLCCLSTRCHPVGSPQRDRRFVGAHASGHGP